MSPAFCENPVDPAAETLEGEYLSSDSDLKSRKRRVGKLDVAAGSVVALNHEGASCYRSVGYLCPLHTRALETVATGPKDH